MMTMTMGYGTVNNKAIPHSKCYVTKDLILEKVSQAEIFSLVFGFHPSNDPKKKNKVCSPFRDDKNPGCYFKEHKNKLFFIDFAGYPTHMDCFDAVKLSFCLNSFYDVLLFIAQQLNVSIGFKYCQENVHNTLNVRLKTKTYENKSITFNNVINNFTMDNTYPLYIKPPELPIEEFEKADYNNYRNLSDEQRELVEKTVREVNKKHRLTGNNELAYFIRFNCLTSVSHLDKVKFEEKIKKINYGTRSFENEDGKFWKKYGITKEQLINDGVVPLTGYSIENSHNDPNCDFFTYLYTDFPNGHYKIYSPYSKDKFISGCTKNDIGGIEKLNYNDKVLVITKSYKDYRVIKNFRYKNVVWFQSETSFPDIEILKHLVAKFDKVMVWFDNDEVGISSSIHLVDRIKSFEFKQNVVGLYISPNIENAKDPSDYVAVYKDLNILFKEKQYVLIN